MNNTKNFIIVSESDNESSYDVDITGEFTLYFNIEFDIVDKEVETNSYHNSFNDTIGCDTSIEKFITNITVNNPVFTFNNLTLDDQQSIINKIQDDLNYRF